MGSKVKYNWEAEAAALPSDEIVLARPVWVILGEGTDTAKFLRAHYKADKKNGVPGMVSAGLPSDMADQIDSLVEAASNASGTYQLTVSAHGVANVMARGDEVVEEMGAAMEFCFNDGVEDEKDTQLANVQSAHKDDPNTPDALALKLEDYALLAEQHKDALDGLGDFDIGLIAEARKIAKELRETPESTTPAPEVRAALVKRNRLLQLLESRIKRVRIAASYVFRRHPEIARKTASVFMQKRRVEARRAATRRKNNGKKQEEKTPITPNA